VLVGSEYRNGEKYFARCPGLGYQIKNGEFKGRILFPTYTAFGETDFTVSMLYSDDGGETWALGEKIKINRGKYKDESGKVLSLDPGYGCEAQLIEFPDGSLRVFARTSSKYIGYADSIDGGVTFNALRNDFGLDYCSDCMISVINYSGKIDGKDAVIISYPERKGRYDGRIKIGLVTENEGFDSPAYGRYTIEWKYKYEINNSTFWYSCLSELDDGRIAIFYEPGTFLVYDEFDIDTIKFSGNYEYALKNISEDESLFKIALKLDEKVYPEFSDLAVATLLATGTDGTRIELEYSGISEDRCTLIFEGEVFEFEKGYSYTVTYPKGNDIMTLKGPVDDEKIAPVIVEYQLEIPTEESTTEVVETTEELTGEITTEEITQSTESASLSEGNEETSESAGGEKDDKADADGGKVVIAAVISGIVGAVIGAMITLAITKFVVKSKKK
jgi:hypothetical protein